MTKEEALTLLESAPTRTSAKPSAVNPGLTQAAGVRIITEAVEEMKPGQRLGKLMEKRVWQVVKNQRRPRY